MGALFDQVGQLIEWLADWIPRIGICRATHRGVRFKWGKQKIEIKPGIYVFWPRVTEAFLYPVVRQTANLPMQLLETRDGTPVVVSVVVVFEICDIIAALADSWDIEDTIADVSLRVAARVVTTNNYEWLRENLTGKAETKLTTGCRSDLRPYGVRVLRVFATDFGRTRSYRIVGDTATIRSAKFDGEAD